jgi:hopanoid biosynthesis associated RND transporter like protein HpnN
MGETSTADGGSGLRRALAGLVEFCSEHAKATVLVGVIVAIVSGAFASRHLRIDTDIDHMFPADLPWRQREIALDRAFPQLQGLLVAVIDAREPEEADATATQLAQLMLADRRHFTGVRRPDSSYYFDKEGLLFLTTAQLTAVLDSMIAAQPLLGTLASDPTARGLFSVLSMLGQGVTRHEVNLAPYVRSLRAFHSTMAATIAGHAQPLSWQNLLSNRSTDLGGRYKFVLATPRLDYGTLQSGGDAERAIRTAAAKLEFVRTGAARVRVTGQVALADAQFSTVIRGAINGFIASLILVALWLVLALRSWRLIIPVLGTLVLGLMLTLLFAAASVGVLNLVSVGFGILFVGIAVDFAIQFTVRFREEAHRLTSVEGALRQTAQRAGGAILIAALATAAAFLSFVPSDFRGVAQLGLIAGAGMLIAFLCTLTFLPASIVLCHPLEENTEVGFAWGAKADALLVRWRAAILCIFAAAFVSAVLLSPHLQFDSNPLDTQNQDTVAMRTLRDLLDSPTTNPFSIDILVRNIDQVRALAGRLKHLSTVSSVLTIDSFVPQHQTEKLALIADAENLIGPTLISPQQVPKVGAADLRLALHKASTAIAPTLTMLPREHPVHAIAQDLRELADAPDKTILEADRALTRFLPNELKQLQTALSAKSADLSSVPPTITRDWVLPGGRARIHVLPVPASDASQGLHAFVQQVSSMAPDAGGAAVTIEASSATIVSAFRSAALLAALAIAVILVVSLRRLRDAACVLVALLLSSALTLLVIVLLPLPLNYANVLALPLLLGVGVSFNIYFVMNWRAGRGDMLASATARAVVFSALTTGTAFGSLALSHHPGTASMGELLLISLGCTLVTALIFVPALLATIANKPLDQNATNMNVD